MKRCLAKETIKKSKENIKNYSNNQKDGRKRAKEKK